MVDDASIKYAVGDIWCVMCRSNDDLRYVNIPASETVFEHATIYNGPMREFTCKNCDAWWMMGEAEDYD